MNAVIVLCGICWFLPVFGMNGHPSAGFPVSAPLQTTQDDDEFTPLRKGQGRALDRTFLEMATYVSSKGGEATVARGTFVSSEAAVKELQSEVGLAKRIISRGSSTNASGQVIGERAVYVFTFDKVDRTEVVWTRGADFYSVSSESEALSLRLEKKLNTLAEKKDKARECRAPMACD